MEFSVIGSGNIGGAFAQLVTRAGMRAGFANTRGPESLRAFAARYAGVVPLALDDAVGSDIVVLATHFRSVAEVGATRSDWSGQIVVDATNSHWATEYAEVLRDREPAHFVAELFPGADVVKAFNQLPAATLAKELDPAVGKRVVFLASDSESAAARVATFAGSIGLAPVFLGSISSSAWLIEVPGPLVLKQFIQRPLDR